MDFSEVVGTDASRFEDIFLSGSSRQPRVHPFIPLQRPIIVVLISIPSGLLFLLLKFFCV